MNIIITAGGTSEPIDNVRKITNSSSGKLGSIIANKFLDLDTIDKIFYVCNKSAYLPTENKKLEIIYVKTVENLQKTLKNLIKSQKIDVIIHSMAVSDYTVQYVTTGQNLINKLSNKSEVEIENILNSDEIKIQNDDKISSNLSDIYIKLVPTPKVISQIKKWDKDIFLVGFKLLSNVTKETLIDVAKNLMQKNNCDVVVANDIKDITATQHKAYIITNNEIIKVNTKMEIAEKLCSLILSIF